MLLAGWALALAAIVLLKSSGMIVVFVLAAIGVEALGLTLVVRSHLLRKEEQ